MREKRRDIQGLRALAVVLVVVFHLWPGRLTGGFVGVDIFFVISGFLITAHLFREIEQTGSVSLAGFWARRIRRLLPAGFVVLAASAVASAIWIPRSLLEQTMVEIGAAATYSLNWVLAANSVDYLAADNDASIVQHYWSLAVEEQFYLIWPLLIIAAAALAVRASRRRTAVPSTRVVVIVALGAVFALSFVYSVFATSESPQSAFFVTTTRAWEFAVGGLLVFAPALRSTLSPTVVAGAGIALGWVGVVLIGVSRSKRCSVERRANGRSRGAYA